jgi:hypothetical protein
LGKASYANDMKHFRVRTLNSQFQTEAEFENFGTVEEVMAEGIKGAMAIAADEINGGSNSVSVEVIVEGEAGRSLLRSVLSVSVAPLLIG